jgi:hypothetical protein
MASHNFCSISGVLGGKNSKDTAGGVAVNVFSSRVWEEEGTIIPYFGRNYVATMQQS